VKNPVPYLETPALVKDYISVNTSSTSKLSVLSDWISPAKYQWVICSMQMSVSSCSGS